MLKSRLSLSSRPGVNVTIAIGNRISPNNFDQWLEELDRIAGHVNVQSVHLKFTLVDPPSNNPVVVIGSANFSEGSNCSREHRY
jgi:phosphatidylserine/phosphatidylglycerophosphate/cardiolipin synthase-like enzyme